MIIAAAHLTTEHYMLGSGNVVRVRAHEYDTRFVAVTYENYGTLAVLTLARGQLVSVELVRDRRPAAPRTPTLPTHHIAGYSGSPVWQSVTGSYTTRDRVYFNSNTVTLNPGVYNFDLALSDMTSEFYRVRASLNDLGAAAERAAHPPLRVSYA